MRKDYRKNSRKNNGSSKGNGEDSRRMQTTDRRYKDTCNAHEWYYLNEQQLKDNASWNFASVLGQPFQTMEGLKGINESVPGLATLYLQPTIGAAASLEDLPINEAGQAIWTWLRSNQKIKQDFDQQDYMAYLIACAQALSAYVALRKVLGCAYLYSAQNKYMPLALINSMNIKPESVIGNMATCRDQLNTLALNMNTIAVPSGMPYFSRQIFLYDNIYKDEDIVKAPMYHYAPSYFWQYDDKGTSSHPGSSLVRVDFCKRELPMTFSEAIDLVMGMVNAIRNSTDGTNMSATTLNAFPDSQLIRAGIINGDYKANIVYNEEVLMQIENALIAGPILNGRIVQDVDKNLFGYNHDKESINGVRSVPVARTNFRVCDHPIVKFHKNNVSPEEIVVATRLVPNIHSGTFDTAKAQWNVIIDSCGTEVVEDIAYTFTYLGNEIATIFASDICAIPVTNPENAVSTLRYLLFYCKFRCAPTLYLTAMAPNRADDYALGTLTDLGNYVVPSNEQIDGVNRMACRAEFWMKDLITMQP